MDIIALEDVSARAWPALHTGRIGGWRLNASTGHTGRANTCWALEAPDRPVDQALEAVEAWYAGLGLPPKFKTVDGATQPVYERFRRRGKLDLVLRNVRKLVEARTRLGKRT
ncbi:MAG: hypothetical protein HY859_15775, partial [Caulobacterales bacterium]|nr:hypothetical protein [Caulobacterales bacterium]